MLNSLSLVLHTKLRNVPFSVTVTKCLRHSTCKKENIGFGSWSLILLSAPFVWNCDEVAEVCGGRLPHSIWKEKEELKGTESQCPLQGHTSAILVFFPVANRKYLDKSSLREKGPIWPTVVTAHYGRGVRLAGGSWSCDILGQQAERGK